MSINSVNISGRLTGNFELKATKAGTAVLEFCVVVTDRRRNEQNGEWTDYPNYINCVMFGKRAASLSKSFEKGMKVAVCGHLKYDTWEKDGTKRSSISVVADDIDLMSRYSGLESQNNSNVGTYSTPTENTPQNSFGGFSDYAESDFPF